jgi:hypothetical protein
LSAVVWGRRPVCGVVQSRTPFRPGFRKCTQAAGLHPGKGSAGKSFAARLGPRTPHTTGQHPGSGPRPTAPARSQLRAPWREQRQHVSGRGGRPGGSAPQRRVPPARCAARAPGTHGAWLQRAAGSAGGGGIRGRGGYRESLPPSEPPTAWGAASRGSSTSQPRLLHRARLGLKTPAAAAQRRDQARQGWRVDGARAPEKEPLRRAPGPGAGAPRPGRWRGRPSGGRGRGACRTLDRSSGAAAAAERELRRGAHCGRSGAQEPPPAG